MMPLSPPPMDACPRSDHEAALRRAAEQWNAFIEEHGSFADQLPPEQPPPL